MFEKIKKWYEMKLWTADMVRQAVVKNVITDSRAEEILAGREKGEQYDPEI